MRDRRGQTARRGAGALCLLPSAAKIEGGDGREDFGSAGMSSRPRPHSLGRNCPRADGPAAALKLGRNKRTRHAKCCSSFPSESSDSSFILSQRACQPLPLRHCTVPSIFCPSMSLLPASLRTPITNRNYGRTRRRDQPIF